MADVTINLKVHAGDLSGLQTVQRHVEETKRRLVAAGDYEILPGDRLRKVNTDKAKPGVGTYAPAFTPPASTLPPLRTTASSATPAPGVLGHATQQASVFANTLRQVNQETTGSGSGIRPLSGRALQFFQAQAQRRAASAQPPSSGGTPPPGGEGTGGGSLPPWWRLPPWWATPPGWGRAGGPGGAGPRSPHGGTSEDDEGGEEEDHNQPGGQRRQGARRAGLVSGINRIARHTLGLAAGIGIYQTLTHAMQLYEQRARGIIAVGSQLGQNFDEVSSTIDTLRSNFGILAHESLPAMEAMGRISGGALAGMPDAMVYAHAHGMPADQAAHRTALLQRLTIAGNSPLALLGYTAGQLGNVNYRPMATNERAEEAIRMAQIGASFGTAVPTEFYGRMAGLIGGLGQQYQVPGAISGFYQRFAEGINNAPDMATYAIRMRALQRMSTDRQARGLGSTYTVGKETFDLNDLYDQQTLLSMAGNVPDLAQAIADESQRMVAGHPGLAKRAFHEIVGGGRLSLLESRRLYQRTQAGANVFGDLGAAVTADQEAADQETAQAFVKRRERPEARIENVEAMTEGGMEKIGRPLVTLSLDLREATAKLGQSMEQGSLDIGKVAEAMQVLHAESWKLLGALTALSSNNWLQATIGALVAGAATVGGSMPQSSDAKPLLNIGPMQLYWPPVAPGATTPQRPGP